MKNKGYTLIELLGVMIILALVVSLVIPSIIIVIKSSTNKTDDIVEELVINAASLYVDDYSDKFYGEEGNVYCISLKTLVELNYLKNKIEIDGVDITNLKSVEITYKNKFNYKIVDNEDCTESY